MIVEGVMLTMSEFSFYLTTNPRHENIRISYQNIIIDIKTDSTLIGCNKIFLLKNG